MQKLDVKDPCKKSSYITSLKDSSSSNQYVNVGGGSQQFIMTGSATLEGYDSLSATY